MAIGGCLTLAVGVAAWTGLSLAQAYLATTPGGIYAVLATANDSGAGGIVVTMQVFRLLVMVFVAIVGSKLLTADHDPVGPRSIITIPAKAAAKPLPEWGAGPCRHLVRLH